MERPTPSFDQIWQQHDELGKLAPRTLEWGLNQVKNEAQELHDEHHDPTSQEFLYEGADVVLAWMTAMKAAGISMEVALQAIWEKTNIVYDRLVQTNEIVLREGVEQDVAYLRVKQNETL
jgi:phosphoribosyl-ATP pyrophosphohydrolase